jgi:hypothetical protein
MPHILALPAELLIRVFDSGGWSHLDRSSIQLTCKTFYRASFASRSLFRAVVLKIDRMSDVSAMRNMLRKISKHNVVRHIVIMCTHNVIENVFVRPLRLSWLRDVEIICDDTPIDVLAIIQSLGCVNARNIEIRAPCISSIHHVAWGRYTNLKRLTLESTSAISTFQFAPDVEFPRMLTSLTLAKMTTMHPALFTLQHLLFVNVDLGSAPFVVPEGAWQHVEELTITASSVPMNMGLANLLYLSWTVTGTAADIAHAITPNVPRHMEKVHIAGPTWIRDAELYHVPSLAFTIRLDMTDLSFPDGTYISTAEFLSLDISRVRGTEYVNYEMLKNARVLHTLELPLEEIGPFVRDMNQDFPLSLEKVVVVYKHNSLSLIDDIIFAVRQFPERITVVVRSCFHSGYFDNDSDDD